MTRRLRDLTRTTLALFVLAAALASAWGCAKGSGGIGNHPDAERPNRADHPDAESHM